MNSLTEFELTLNQLLVEIDMLRRSVYGCVESLRQSDYSNINMHYATMQQYFKVVKNQMTELQHQYKDIENILYHYLNQNGSNNG